MNGVEEGLAQGAIFPTMADPVAEEHFARDGVVVLPLIERDQARALRAEVLDLLPPDPGPFLDLFRNNPPELRKQIDRLIRGALEEQARAVFHDHEFWSAAVLVKPPGAAGEIGLHTDWNMVDEDRYRSGLIWVALDDTNEDNGGIVVVPGTNRLDIPYRGLNVHFDFGEPDVQQRIGERRVPLSVPVGHAAIWDNRLLHGSGPNTTDEWRVVAALGFKPREAQLYHYRPEADGRSHRYAIEREFFLDYQPFDPTDAPSGRHVLGDEVLDGGAWELSADDIAALGELGGVWGAGPEPSAEPAAPARSQSRWRRALARRGR